VGAISVHLICGIWGTLAVGIFSTNPEHSFLVQLIGIACYGAFTFAAALGIFGVLKLTMGIRVSEDEELEGLDLGEHGMHAYDLGAGPGWLEQPPGRATQSLLAAPPKLAPSESEGFAS
jgi:Amt family ammonium transporter